MEKMKTLWEYDIAYLLYDIKNKSKLEYGQCFEWQYVVPRRSIASND